MHYDGRIRVVLIADSDHANAGRRTAICRGETRSVYIRPDRVGASQDEGEVALRRPCSGGEDRRSDRNIGSRRECTANSIDNDADVRFAGDGSA